MSHIFLLLSPEFPISLYFCHTSATYLYTFVTQVLHISILLSHKCYISLYFCHLSSPYLYTFVTWVPHISILLSHKCYISLYFCHLSFIYLPTLSPKSPNFLAWLFPCLTSLLLTFPYNSFSIYFPLYFSPLSPEWNVQTLFMFWSST